MCNKTESARQVGEKSTIFRSNDWSEEYSNISLKMHISQKRYICVFKKTLPLRCLSVHADENGERGLLFGEHLMLLFKGVPLSIAFKLENFSPLTAYCF